MDVTRPLDFSRSKLSSLSESALDEPNGIGYSGSPRNTVFGVAGFPRAVLAAGPIDWNNNSTATDTGVAVEINTINGICVSSRETATSLLSGFDDWQNIRLGFRDSQAFNDGVRVTDDPELTEQGVVDVGLVLDEDGDGIVDSNDNCAGTANPSQLDTDSDGYGDACDPGTGSAVAVTIVTPLTGDPIAAGNVEIEAAATASGAAVTLVELFDGGVKIGQATTDPFIYSWTGVTPGIYTLTAVATDASGAVATSDPVMLTVVSDTIFADGFESGGLGAWSASVTDGGDLSVSAAAALKATTQGLQAVVNDTVGIYVQDGSPDNEQFYRARFHFNTGTFDPGEAQAHFRTRVFIGFKRLQRGASWLSS